MLLKVSTFWNGDTVFMYLAKFFVIEQMFSNVFSVLSYG
jgi:hypothetical protein